MKSASTYRAVQAVSTGKLELTEKPLSIRQLAMSASVSRPVACATRIPRRSKGYCRSSGRGSPATRRSGGSM